MRATLPVPFRRGAFGAALSCAASFCGCLPAAAVPLEAGPLGVCLKASAASAGATQSGFVASGLHVALLSGSGSPTLEAAGMRLSQARGTLSPDALRQAALTAVAAMLQQAMLAGHPHAAIPCPPAALRVGSDPLQGALLAGGSYAFEWSGATVQAGGNGTRVGTLSMTAQRQGTQVVASLSLRGIAPAHPVPGVAIPSPQSLDLHVSGPADRIAGTLSGGLSAGETVPFTLDAAELVLGAAHFTLHGSGTAGATPQDGSFDGTLTATDFDAAIEEAGRAGLDRLRTGLYLARLAARQKGEVLSWKLQWQQGVLFVNDVPLPIR